MRSRLLALTLASCLGPLGACALVPAQPTSQATSESPQLAAEVQRLTEEARSLLQAQDLLLWRFWSEGARADMAMTYANHPHLFSLESLRKLEQLRQRTTDEREQRALAALHAHFAGEYLSAQLADINDAIANLEASLTFSVEGREVRYRDLERQLANERSAPRRRALYAAATPALVRLNQSLRRRQERLLDLVQELGYPSYKALGGELRQADLDRLGQLAEKVLAATQAPYETVMERLARRELGLPFASLSRADLLRLFRARDVDAFFPQGELLLRTHGTLASMGLDLTAMPNVQIDSRDLPRKNPRPLTLALNAPKDVRLSVRPGEGAQEQARLLHEVGHALHYAFTQEKRFELARLGNPTVSEAHAALFEDLMEDPVWLEEHANLTGKERAEYLAAASAYKLFRIRRAAGRLLYQLAVHREEAAEPRELYKELMGRAEGLPMSEDEAERYLVDMEDFFQSADHFRAWFLAGQLQGQLKARFGPAWWRSPQAGSFLKSLWAHGNALSAREVAEALGEQGIEPDVLLLRLGTTLQVPVTLEVQPESPSAPQAPPAPAEPLPATGGAEPEPESPAP